jgi:hypothetical protein
MEDWAQVKTLRLLPSRHTSIIFSRVPCSSRNVSLDYLSNRSGKPLRYGSRMGRYATLFQCPLCLSQTSDTATGTK